MQDQTCSVQWEPEGDPHSGILHPRNPTHRKCMNQSHGASIHYISKWYQAQSTPHSHTVENKANQNKKCNQTHQQKQYIYKHQPQSSYISKKKIILLIKFIQLMPKNQWVSMIHNNSSIKHPILAKVYYISMHTKVPHKGAQSRMPIQPCSGM